MKYPPPHHQENEFQNIIEVVKNYPFATMVTLGKERPFITHIPLVYVKDDSTYGKLVGHIDKFNPQVETLVDGAMVTAVFRGPDCYISPSIYGTRQLPTWNYICAHLEGTLHLLTDSDRVKQTLVAMTSFLEGDNPQYILEYTDSRMERLIDYIVGFEITITRWEGKFKFSQDKSNKDMLSAKQELILSQQKDVSSFVERIFENHKNGLKA